MLLYTILLVLVAEAGDQLRLYVLYKCSTVALVVHFNGKGSRVASSMTLSSCFVRFIAQVNCLVIFTTDLQDVEVLVLWRIVEVISILLRRTMYLVTCLSFTTCCTTCCRLAGLTYQGMIDHTRLVSTKVSTQLLAFPVIL